jgi:stearoyl-CoA desaturase (Delta-9 desaturase)
VRRIQTRVRVINMCAVIIPFLGLFAAIALSWGVALNWTVLAVSLGMGLATSLGVTVGFHRLFTHKSFRTYAPVRFIFAALGSMAVQGPVIEWAGTHRKHHQHSDEEGDPHSPHVGAGGSWGSGIRGVLRGAWHAHMGWLFVARQEGLGRYTKDLHGDRVVVAVNRQFRWWVLIGLLLPALLAGLLTMSLMGALLGFLWGGLVRVLVVHHLTWSVNSVCHLWGSQPFRSHDESRNNPIVGILGLGEGWHNNHHAFPASARHGLRWWEIDISYMVIRAMALVGLAHDVRIPAPERLVAKRRVGPGA